MKHLFVPYHIALALKEKGFDEQCFAVVYSDGQVIEQLYGKLKLSKTEELCVAAPLYQQVIDWLREKHNVIVSVQPRKDKFIGVREYYIADAWRFNSTDKLPYYEALTKAIEEALTLI